ncbi:MAG: tryptophan synthase subunit alpha, partial [Chloroflexi bacterium RBG_13_52_14]
GITITKASHHALKNGITPEACLDVAAYLSKKIRIPLMFMSYYNPVFKYDLEKFCHKCTLNGIDGLIIPDLPPDEGEIIDKICQKNDLDIVYLLAPNCSDDRIRLVSRRSKGFIYLVSVTGVTGVRNELPENIGTFVSRVKRIAGPKPLCVGFGISTAAQAVKAARLADGIIIGSRIIQLLEPVNTAEAPLQTYIKEIRQSLDY